MLCKVKKGLGRLVQLPEIPCRRGLYLVAWSFMLLQGFYVVQIVTSLPVGFLLVWGNDDTRDFIFDSL